MLSVSLAAAAVWLVVIFFLHRLSRYEERPLLERFGAEYERYMLRYRCGYHAVAGIEEVDAPCG
jgi:protein-S-isoprenylcysteine O-methyltransferase Ste14